MLLALNLATFALFPGLAPPPSPDGLLSKVAELILRARLRECESCEIAVDAQPSSLLGGAVDGVRVNGKRWCTPLKLSCDSLDVQVGQTSVDFSALVTKQRIDLKRPAEGSATIKFTAEDWDNFLLHPGFKEIVTRRRRTDPTPPDFAFSRKGGTRMLPSAGSIAFPVRWDGATLMATLSQRADGRVECAATCSKAPEGSPAWQGDSPAGPWLAQTFENLVLDLDGCELSFRKLRVEPSELLVLELGVCVRSFPSLDINF